MKKKNTDFFNLSIKTLKIPPFNQKIQRNVVVVFLLLPTLNNNLILDYSAFFLQYMAITVIGVIIIISIIIIF